MRVAPLGRRTLLTAPQTAFTLAVMLGLVASGCSGRDGDGLPEDPPPLAQESAEHGGWLQKARLPTSRSEVASALLDGVIYVIGGFDPSGRTTAVVEAYDTASDTWRRLAPLPQPRDHAMGVALDGKVYVFGGSNGDATKTAFAYEPAADHWTRLPDMPFARTAGGAAVLEGRILVVGGTGDSPTTSMVFDPATQRWSNGPALPAPREHLAVAFRDGAVYAVGGRWEGELKSDNEVLTSLAGTWRKLAPLPTARGGTAGSAVGGIIAVAGGEAFGPSRTFAEVELYDSSTDSWRRAPDLPTPRHGLAVVGVGDTLYVIGGGPTAGLSVSPANEALPLQ